MVGSSEARRSTETVCSPPKPTKKYDYQSFDFSHFTFYIRLPPLFKVRVRNAAPLLLIGLFENSGQLVGAGGAAAAAVYAVEFGDGLINSHTFE